MTTVITTAIDIEEREKGFQNALDMFAHQKIPEECARGLYSGVYKTLLFIFLANLEDRKQKMLEEFKDKTSLSRGEWECLQKRIKEL